MAAGQRLNAGQLSRFPPLKNNSGANGGLKISRPTKPDWGRRFPQDTEIRCGNKSADSNVSALRVAMDDWADARTQPKQEIAVEF
jgi:hypothetical protein